MTQKPSAVLATFAVLMLAAGLLLAYFTRGTPSGAKAVPPTGAVSDPSKAPNLLGAIISGNLVELKAALTAGASVTDPIGSGPNAGMTPLHLAAATPASSQEVIRTLIAAGATVDARTPDGRTPLMLAAEFGRPASIAALANANAALDARDQTGKMALMFAASAGRADNAQALLAAGASVNAADESGATAIALTASSRADASVLRILLDAGADPDAADGAGVTPLMRAAEAGQPDKVLSLLNAGASPKARSADGRSALDRARTHTDEPGKRCLQILEQAGP